MEITTMKDKVVNQSVHTFSRTQPSTTDPRYRPDIDGLRAIAVFSVVICHAFPSHFPGGLVGVDIFFVISGYLISSIICNGLDTDSFSFAEFYSRRIRRIFPSLIVVLVACYVLAWHLFFPAEFKMLGAHILAGSGFFSNFLLSGKSGYFSEPIDTKPLLHLWSLGIEEQFYIIWPIFLYMSRKIKVNLLTLTVILIFSSFILNVSRVKTNNKQTFYWPTSRIWELLIGAQITFVTKYANDHFQNVIIRRQSFINSVVLSKASNRNNDILCIVTSIVGVLLVTLPMYFITETSIIPGWWVVPPTVGTAFLISIGPTAWINRHILSSRFLVGIGLISYPLYLWHLPLLVFMRIYLGDKTSISTHIAVIILSIIIAWITYIFIEKPFRFGQFSKAKLTLLCVSMLILGFVGYYTYRSDGLSFRFPPLIRNIIYYDNRYAERNVIAYRLSTCFLDSQRDETQFDTCVDNMDKSASTAVILCGDSHAAHLYPGIVATKSDLRITQLTANECPPIYGISVDKIPACKPINDYIFRRISYEKPNTIVLAANWAAYQWKNLTETIEYLKNVAVKNIYLVGPVPRWTNGLPRSLYIHYLRNALPQIPSRMHFGLNRSTEHLDKMMEVFAIKMTINYISPYKILCNKHGCLTKTGKSVDSLTAFDSAHLTIAGSTFLVARFPKNLLHAGSQKHSMVRIIDDEEGSNE